MKKVAILLPLVFLSGCGGVLECNDSKAKDTAMEIIQSQLEKAVWYVEMSPNISDVEISNVKTTAHDESIKQNSCSAEYSFSYKDKQYKTDFEYTLSFLEDKKDTDVSVDVGNIKSRFMAIGMFGR